MPIQAPKRPDDYPDRFLDCQMAIEDGVLQLLGDAQTAGWSRAEVLAAIIEVADNTSLALDENERLDVETHLKKFLGGD